MTHDKTLTDASPVLIAAGQFMQPIPNDLTECLSPADIAGHAARAALEALPIDNLAQHIDLIASVRTFSDSSPAYTSPFGRSDNFPLSVASRVGANPKHLIYDVIGGQSPQKLVTECCNLLAEGSFEMALIVGGEALGNMKAAQAAEVTLEWGETPKLPEGTSFEDRGFGDVTKMVSASEVNHGLFDPMLYYGFMETARRAELGLERQAYRQKMADLMAPFSQIAETNPYAMFKERFTPAELARLSPRNRQLTTPYLKHFVAKDGVNQGAAVLLTTVGKAKALGIDRKAWIFLHGAADTEEKLLLEREKLGESLALNKAFEAALTAANLTGEAIAYFDLYSCFPIVVFNACKALAIQQGDKRSLTQTGGLPFFGGPGNNYTLHAIASMVETLQNNPDEFGLIHGNGGWMSKHSVGIYSNQAPHNPWAKPTNGALQKTLDDVEAYPQIAKAEGRAKIESYIVIYARGEPLGALIIGRLKDTDERFYARSEMNSKAFLESLDQNGTIGRDVMVTNTPQGNVFSLFDSVFE